MLDEAEEELADLRESGVDGTRIVHAEKDLQKKTARCLQNANKMNQLNEKLTKSHNEAKRCTEARNLATEQQASTNAACSTAHVRTGTVAHAMEARNLQSDNAGPQTTDSAAGAGAGTNASRTTTSV